MTSWSPQDLSPRGPVYVAIADALAADVRAGRLQPGERLPTHRALARALGVNVVTVTRAYAEAARRGLVQGEVGRGTFVRFTPREASAARGRSERSDVRVDFELGVPCVPAELLDARPLFEELVRDPAAASLETGYVTPGLPRHRESAARWLARAGLEAEPGRTLVTCGAQHALQIALGSLTEPGDTLLVAELTYPGVKALASAMRLRLAPVALDGEGLVPDALVDACRRANARALYCMPNVQNPTGCVLPTERRRDVAAIAARFGLAIVEDDTSGFVCDPPPPPLARFAPDRTTFVTSLAKSVAPGLRIGYLHAPEPPEERERVLAHAAAASWMTPGLMAELASRWIDDGTAERIVAWKRAEYAARRRALDARLGEDASPSDPGSAYAWLPLPAPWRGADFVEQARRRGIGLTPAEAFVAGRAEAPHAVRLSLGRPPTRERVEEGLDVLAAMLSRPPEPCRAVV